MKGKFIGFVLGAIVGAIIFGSVAIAANTEMRTLNAAFSGIRIDIDQTRFTPTDVTGKEVEPFIVDGTTYLPVRAIAEAFNKDVVWDSELKIIRIFAKSEPLTEAEVSEAFAEFYLSDDTLQDYKINSAELYDLEFLRNVWRVDFSVLPKEGHNGWMAGNGGLGENGWIVNKMLFVYVTKTDGVVDLWIIGTGL